MTSIVSNNFHKTQENKYPEFNRNMTLHNNPQTSYAYQKLVREQKGGYYALPNPQLVGWNMQMRQPGYNQNFLGLKSSHFIPHTGRYTWDMYHKNDSSPKVQDKNMVYFKSQVPRQFS
jgi:hypothetical protein